MGMIPEYIGCPGYQKNHVSPSNMDAFRKHMQEKFVIAEIIPCKAKVDSDGNIYKAIQVPGEFAGDLGNAGHSMSGSVLKVVISNPQAVTETYSNQFGDSEIIGGAGRSIMGNTATELAFLTGAKDVNELDRMAQDFAKTSPILGGAASKLTGLYTKGVKALEQKGKQLESAGYDGAGAAIQQLAGLASAPWSKTNWPQMWKNCSYQQTYELNTRLYCYYNNQQKDYEDNILAPLAAFQLLVTPSSKDGVLYTWPYIIKFKIDGVLDMPMAYCSSLQVVKGGDEGDFAADGRPNIIDIRMSIQNCFSVMVNCAKPKASEIPTVARDNAGLKKGKAMTGEPGSVGNSSGNKKVGDTSASPSESSSSSSASSSSPTPSRTTTSEQKKAKDAGIE